MSRGVGTIMMTHIMNLAKAANVPLQAHFIHNGRNRLMYITYKFGGFTINTTNGIVILENKLQNINHFLIMWIFVLLILPSRPDRFSKAFAWINLLVKTCQV